MFELIIIFAVVLIFPSITSVLGKVFLFVLMLIVIAPGMYATLWGAPYVPTTKNRLKVMLKFAQTKEEDKVVDLGCGDGRVIAAFADEGAKKAIGYEFSVLMFLVAKLRQIFRNGSERIFFKNFWYEKIEDFDVIICFLLDNAMKDFEKKIWPKLKKGTKVISNDFKMGSVSPDKEESRIYLYIKK
jgi:ribosomal protein L11 methylase PrmA